MTVKRSRFNPECITYSQMNLIFNSRIYYRRLTAWTRAYLLSRYFGIGMEEELFGRLYVESLDIGNMLQIIFGREASEYYSQLLSQYAIGLSELVTAQLEGNREAAAQRVEGLYKNVSERADFLEQINPYWSGDRYRELLGAYTRYVLEEANALAAGNFNEAMEIHDRLTDQTNTMGDVFAEGLYRYITTGSADSADETRENVQCITFDQMNAIYEIRMFWFELVIWIRNYMLSRYRDMGNTEAVYSRLRRVAAGYVDAVRKIFGENVSEDYLQLFYAYFDLLAAFITAQLEGNTEELDRITRLLYQNADDRAESIASVNPYWEAEEWRNRLYNNLRATIDESTTFLTGDYARNIDIFSRLLDQAESTSSYFAQGLFQYINAMEQDSSIVL